ncbi:pimeloyl-ACP methyl ester carboxylesterase [Streptomyces netropsis]|uniref:Pimeloyl-ACP methyl ester carboxylesterase n=2 Tax=Streptomyces netropsis TaxID=55404 RepID=A0A7W7LHW9_STRNE|nr:alpha/beta hydrolase [Streptomyces netropsis]MBB4890505.1 pimeloyl-ACP methyl ester carboxylesterase [Streptomyces netropsis]
MPSGATVFAMAETKARNVGPSGIEIAYERFGAPDAPPVLLIMGAGAQMINWPEGFCQALVDCGLQVIRFDTRDSGQSTHFRDAPVPDFPAALAGDLSTASYSLSDLAADTVGLLDALGLAGVHLVGSSMGGMIAQMVAIEYPDRVRSLTSMMSTTGEPGVGEADFSVFAELGGPPQDREAFVEWQVRALGLAASPGFAFDAAAAAERAGRVFDRGYDALGMQRQGLAVVATGDRTERLRSLRVPTLVVHGASDILCDVSGGRATAAAVPGAELVILEGMGHNLPQDVWPELVGHIAMLVHRVEGG